LRFIVRPSNNQARVSCCNIAITLIDPANGGIECNRLITTVTYQPVDPPLQNKLWILTNSAQTPSEQNNLGGLSFAGLRVV
jgi:hypothetical protein